jgi:DNA-binding CsgD family transcriptional regulator/pimeloyl-ACP methyl ester carboxylesterase
MAQWIVSARSPVAMPRSGPEIRYCAAEDGPAIAWSSIGSGPALLFCRVINHFAEAARRAPFWPFVERIARGRRLVVYDGPGSGLSDRGFEALSIEQSARALGAVADAAGLDRFAIFADAAGTQTAIAFAAQHPERIDRLVVYAGMVRGLAHRAPSPKQLAQRDALYTAARAGWDDGPSTFRMLNALDALPEATPREQADFAGFVGHAVTGDGFVRFMRMQAEADVSAFAADLRCSTLVIHPSRCLRPPLDEGRRLASLIPSARLMTVDSANMLPMLSDPTVEDTVAAVRLFLDEGHPPNAAALLVAGLTMRERQVLGLMALGLDNPQIAARLGLAEKTVRNHITPLFEKLGTATRAQAILKALRAGLGDGGEAGPDG